MHILLFLLPGAAGAIIKDIVKDNKLCLPKIDDGHILMGFTGGMVIGAGAGYVIDGNPLTAFLAGFTGSQVIESLIFKNKVK